MRIEAEWTRSTNMTLSKFRDATKPLADSSNVSFPASKRAAAFQLKASTKMLDLELEEDDITSITTTTKLGTELVKLVHSTLLCVDGAAEVRLLRPGTFKEDGVREVKATAAADPPPLLLAEQAIVAARNFAIGFIVNAASAAELRAADPMQGMVKLLSAQTGGGTAARGNASGSGGTAGKRGLGLSAAELNVDGVAYCREWASQVANGNDGTFRCSRECNFAPCKPGSGKPSAAALAHFKQIDSAGAKRQR